MHNHLIEFSSFFAVCFIVYIVSNNRTEKNIKEALGWAGVYILMVFVCNLISMPKADAYQIIDIFVWIYAICFIVTIGEKIYRWGKLTFDKKQDVPKA